MNELEKQILHIIRRAIKPSADCDVPTDAPWDLIFSLGKQHNIIPILCEGILNSNIDESIKKRFADEYRRHALIHFGQMQRLDTITNAFDKIGIDYMILKGSRLKALYPKPEMRVMGDFDILIKLEQYEKIEECLKGLGLIKVGESDHELIFKDNQFVHLELHKRLVPSYNNDFFQYFGTGWERAKRKDAQRCEFLLSKEDEFVFVFTHFAKHYRDGGIGIRHILDIYLFGAKNPDIDFLYIEGELENLNLLKFYKNIQKVISAWFDDEPFCEVSKIITDKIFGSGAYGTKEEANKARALKASNRYKTAFGAKMVSFFKTAFPSAEVMRGSYPILNRASWFLPFAWAHRLLKGVFFKQQTFKKEVLKLKSIKKENIEDYQTELEKVGLGTEF